jgi:hypothetical protein
MAFRGGLNLRDGYPLRSGLLVYLFEAVPEDLNFTAFGLAVFS